MSSPGRGAPPAEWVHLELAVRRLLDRADRCRRRAEEAERRAEELQSTLREVAAGDLDPRALHARIEALEAENRDLRQRLEAARRNVDRILERLRFVEEQR